jgi:Flp pilus assembly CpaE family ATPase
VTFGPGAEVLPAGSARDIHVTPFPGPKRPEILAFGIDKVSMPRRQRNRATVSAHGESGTSSPIVASSVSRRTSSASIAPT